jgi:hypothetical protein
MAPRFLIACLALALLPACTSVDLRSAQQAYRGGNLSAAQNRIDRYVQKQRPAGDSLVLALLEQGTVRHARGEFELSNQSFAAADAWFVEFDNAPDISVSRETLAALSNLNALPYRGTDADRIMANTYRALNFLLLGKPAAARVELRRAYERQRQAVQANAERIREANALATAPPARRSDGGRYNTAAARRDPQFNRALDRQYADLDRFRGYGDYVNPFTEWLQGVYHLGEAVDGNDLEWSRKSFERLAGIVPDNPYVQEDHAAAEAIAAGGPIEPVTYVVFATGTAPLRTEMRIDIPLWIFDSRVDYVGANFPRLIFNPAYVRQLTVRSDTGTYPTRLLADMDAVIATDFRNDLPVIVTKTLVAAGTKAAIAYGVRRSLESQDSEIALLFRIFATIYQYAANQADLRTWASLPKQYQIARLPTPAPASAPGLGAGRGSASKADPDAFGRRSIEVVLPGRSPIRVALDSARINVVLVRSITATLPPIIHRFSLGPLPESSPWPAPDADPNLLPGPSPEPTLSRRKP